MLGTLGLPELLVILALVLIVFGAGKLPNVMSSMGEGVREFRKASEGDFDDDDKSSKATPAAAAKSEPAAPQAESARKEAAAVEAPAAGEAKPE